MRVTSGSSARAEWYDRNPSSKGVDAASSPGAATLALVSVWSYTTPTGKKANVNTISGRVRNLSTSPLNDIAEVRTEFPGSAGNIRRTLCAILAGHGSADDFQHFDNFITLASGQSLEGLHISANTGEATNVSIESFAVITEFDA